jgi:hypothetical protein
MEVSRQFHVLATLPPEKEPLVRLSGPQNQSEGYGEKKNIAYVGNQTLAVQLIACSYTN